MKNDSVTGAAGYISPSLIKTRAEASYRVHRGGLQLEGIDMAHGRFCDVPLFSDDGLVPGSARTSTFIQAWLTGCRHNSPTHKEDLSDLLPFLNTLNRVFPRPEHCWLIGPAIGRGLLNISLPPAL